LLMMGMRCQPQLENHMTRPVTAFVRTILCALIWLAILENLPARAQECLTKPNLKTPQDGHWYYRIDRATHLKCWYVGQPGEKLRQTKPKVHPSRRIVAQTTPSAPGAAPEKTDKASWRLLDEPKDVTTNIVRSAAPEQITTSDRPAELAAPTTAGVEDEYLESSFGGAPPMIWPVLSTGDLAAGAPRNEFPIKPEHLPAGLAAALAFIAVMISTSSAVWRPRRRHRGQFPMPREARMRATC
jgi:hypothetical protein